MNKTRIKNALRDALCKTGRNKGMLKSRCPAVDTDGAAAWMALQTHANPYKVTMTHMFLMSQERKEQVYKPIKEMFEGMDIRKLDRDRKLIDLHLGAW